jgi:uncharacterized membrane protein
MYNLLLSGYLSDLVEEPAKWLTIGLLGALLLIYLVMLLTCLIAKLMDNEVFAEKTLSLSKKFLKSAGIGFVFYALALGIFLLVAEIMKKFDTAYLEENWVSLDVVSHVLIPLLATLVVALIGGITLFVLSKMKPEKIKIALAIFGIVLAVCVFMATSAKAEAHHKCQEQGNCFFHCLSFFL